MRLWFSLQIYALRQAGGASEAGEAEVEKDNIYNFDKIAILNIPEFIKLKQLAIIPWLLNLIIKRLKNTT